MGGLTRDRLRNMRDRWQRDYEALEKAYPEAADTFGGGDGSVNETMRNLATAIAEIDGVITARRRGDRAALNPQKMEDGDGPR